MIRDNHVVEILLRCNGSEVNIHDDVKRILVTVCVCIAYERVVEIKEEEYKTLRNFDLDI